MRLFELEQPVEDLIKINCSDAVDSDVSLYRGMFRRDKTNPIAIRSDRKPKNSSKIEIKIFDYCMSKWGYPHRKSNTVSVTNKPRQTKAYGALQYVFPYDGSSYLYSTKYEDFLYFPEDITHGFWLENRPSTPWSFGHFHDPNMLPMFDGIFDYIDKHHQDFRDRFTYTSDINELSNAAGEILVHGSNYIAVSYNVARNFDRIFAGDQMQ